MIQAQSSLAGIPVILLGLILLVVAIGLSWIGMKMRHRADRAPGNGQDSKGHDDDVTSAVVPAVLGLLALLLGFTFALAVDRYETRRGLVLEEANAIGTAYLQTQILPEPNRERLSVLLIRYTDNRIALAGGSKDQNFTRNRAENDKIINDIWAATLAGFDSIKHLDMSSAFVSSINAVIDLDTSRKTGRAARVPEEVFWVLIFYVMVAALIVGNIIRTRSGFYLVCVMNLLVVISLMLIVDIDNPALGGIRESQFPMKLLSQSMHAESRQDYDRWRTNENVRQATD